MQYATRLAHFFCVLTVVAALVVIALTVYQGVEATAIEIKQTLLLAFGGVLLTGWGVWLCCGGWRTRFHPGLALLALWLLYHVVLLVVSWRGEDGAWDNLAWAAHANGQYLAAISVALVVATLRWTRFELRLLMVGVLTSSIVVGAYATLQWLGHDFVDWAEPGSGRTVRWVVSTLGNKNFVGDFQGSWSVYLLPLLLIPSGAVLARLRMPSVVFNAPTWMLGVLTLLAGAALAGLVYLVFAVAWWVPLALALAGFVAGVMVWRGGGHRLLVWPAHAFVLSKGQLWLAGIWLFLVFTVLISLSRGAFLGMVLGFGVLLVFGLLAVRSVLVRGVLVAMVVVMLSAGLIGALFSTRTESLRHIGMPYVEGMLLQSSSFAIRIVLWQIAVNMWQDAPMLGLGQGRYALQFLPYFEELMFAEDSADFRQVARHMIAMMALRAHNEYFQILAEQGIVGLVLFLMMLVGALLPLGLTLMQRLRFGRPNRLDAVRAGVFACIICNCGLFLWTFPLRLPASAFLFYLMIGLAIALSSPPPMARLFAGWRVAGALIGVAAIAAGTLFWIHGGREHQANRHYKQGFDLLHQYSVQRTDPQLAERARDHFHACLRLSPAQGRAHFQLGNWAYLAEMNIDRSLRYYQIARQTYDNPVLWTNMAHRYFDLEHYEAAARIWEVFAVMQPEKRGTYFQLGLIAYRQARSHADLQNAIDLFRHEIDGFTSLDRQREQELLANCWLYLGLSHYHRDEFVDALQALLTSLSYEPRNVQANLHVGRIYARPHLEVANTLSALYHLYEALRGAQQLRRPRLEQEINLELAGLHAQVRDLDRRQREARNASP